MTFSIKPPSTSAFTALPEQPDADSRSNQASYRQARSAETQASVPDTRPYASVTDRQLIGLIRDHFREFAAGATDSYVNFNELKEAAGLVATDRTFSPEAHHAARSYSHGQNCYASWISASASSVAPARGWPVRYG